jgi:murein DD-endopeptidase MepM/ murein hydrolase activator NlpD
LALFIAPVVIGCMPATPETVFDWDVNDQAQQRAAVAPTQARSVASARNTGAKTYIYHDGAISRRALAPVAAVPVPMPRPQPARLAQAEPMPRPSLTPASYSPSAAPSTSSPAAGTFAWPVQGAVISGFGMTSTGGKNDGINIATPMDTPIHAAASGTVIYAGDELKAYGNLVLIKHTGDFTTAYAHADRLAVSRGDFVSKGQVIGYTGQTGDVSRPQLHFEVRSGTTPVNPRAYLSVQQARS